MSTKTARVTTVWELRSYDVWGNAKDGYEVNDTSVFDREYQLDIPIEVNNAGKPGEFLSAYPTDRQIRAAFGVRCQIDLDGDDTTIYINRRRDSYPIGEMHCTSHASLSPVRKDTGQ